MDTMNGAAQKAAASRAYGAAQAHPIEAIQKDWLRTQLETKHFLMSSIYGSHLPMAVRMEMETLSKVQRLPACWGLCVRQALGRDDGTQRDGMQVG